MLCKTRCCLCPYHFASCSARTQNSERRLVYIANRGGSTEKGIIYSQYEPCTLFEFNVSSSGSPAEVVNIREMTVNTGMYVIV
jgi:hypothetical protein